MTDSGANETGAESQRWVSVDEIAHLGVQRNTMYKWIDRKSLPGHRIGRLWKIRVNEVDEWVRAGGGTSSSKHGEQ